MKSIGSFWLQKNNHNAYWFPFSNSKKHMLSLSQKSMIDHVFKYVFIPTGSLKGLYPILFDCVLKGVHIDCFCL